MARPENGDRVTNKQLYQELNQLRQELPNRREVYLVIGSALVLGQIAARLDVGTLRVLTPQPQAFVELALRLF